MATAAVLRSHDFYEGVRAAVIDKDRNPQWRQRDLLMSRAADVDAYLPAVNSPALCGKDQGRIINMTIGFIGLGHMGGPMAANLAKAGPCGRRL